MSGEFTEQYIKDLERENKDLKEQLGNTEDNLLQSYNDNVDLQEQADKMAEALEKYCYGGEHTEIKILMEALSTYKQTKTT